MATDTNNSGARLGSRLRIAAWAVAALILLLPLVAMQFTDEVNWGLADFIFAALLLFGTCTVFEIAVRRTGNFAYQLAVGVALVAAFTLVWVNVAVGIIGGEGESANLMYGGVLAVGLIGAFLARFQPQGMARALFATAIAHALVAVIALAARLGATGPIWPLDILATTGFFVALFVGSALLFQKAAREQSLMN